MISDIDIGYLQARDYRKMYTEQVGVRCPLFIE